MVKPQKSFSYKSTTSLPHSRLCLRKEPATITSRKRLENTIRKTSQ
jgi:hypothetical protein